jgi:truncated hemoglobin YjbI
MAETQTTFYKLMGGEKTLTHLVERFYFYMDSLPETISIRQIHAEDLSKLYNN